MLRRSYFEASGLTSVPASNRRAALRPLAIPGHHTLPRCAGQSLSVEKCCPPTRALVRRWQVKKILKFFNQFSLNWLRVDLGPISSTHWGENGGGATVHMGLMIVQAILCAGISRESSHAPAQVVQPDLIQAGGIWESRKIAAMAEPRAIALAPHCPFGPSHSFLSPHARLLLAVALDRQQARPPR